MREHVVGGEVPSDVMAIKHFGAAIEAVEYAGIRCMTAVDVADISMLQARMSDALLRQHDMSEQRTCGDALFPRGNTACMQGRDATGAPAQRTVTSANAAYGIAIWITIERIVMSQTRMFIRRFKLRPFYHMLLPSVAHSEPRKFLVDKKVHIQVNYIESHAAAFAVSTPTVSDSAPNIVEIRIHALQTPVHGRPSLACSFVAAFREECAFLSHQE